MKKGSIVFWSIYVVFFGLLIGAVFYGLHYLHDFLVDYEQSMPAKLMDGLTAKMNEGSYAEYVALSNFFEEFSQNVFATPEVMMGIVGEAIDGQAVTYKKIFSPDRVSAPAFGLMLGEETLSTVHLALSGQVSEFGQPLYLIDRIEDFNYDVEDMVYAIPEDFTLLINGVALGEEWIVSRADDMFDGKYAIDRARGVPQICTYLIDGLIPVSSLSVLMPGGKEATLYENPDGIMVTSTHSVNISAPSDADVYVNGVEISRDDLWLSSPPIEFEILERIPDKHFPNEQKPAIHEYRVTGILTEPEVEITHPDRPLNVTSDGENYVAEQVWSGYDEKALMSLAQEYARLHAKVTADDIDISSYLAVVLAGAPLRTDLQRGLWPHFYTNHGTYWFEDETAENLQFYTEDCFSVDVSLVHCIGQISSRPGAVEKFAFSMRMCFVRSSGVWKLAEWSLLG